MKVVTVMVNMSMETLGMSFFTKARKCARMGVGPGKEIRYGIGHVS